MEILRKRFISGWSLLADLEALKEDSVKPEYVQVARHFSAHYAFPVMMYVAYSNGTIAHKFNANDFLDSQKNIMEDGLASLSSAALYERFLLDGVARCAHGEVALLQPEDGSNEWQKEPVRSP
ncbi:hypothetical protein DPMN_088362 [Dreissena polymorpha]|uniref:Uncharacterized protein n=3 Tax=Dreissena polymorpha TaxID=45954 RepID=A0A9D4KU00_DREPO|nr:hypothetical protein DPMN_088362 [Dreissena polymorpha]